MLDRKSLMITTSREINQIEEAVISCEIFRLNFNSLMHMSQNGQTHFKNHAAFAARFLKCLTILGHYVLKG